MKSNPLPEIIHRLQAAELMPPVKSVETAGGGIIRVIVASTLDPKIRARLTAALGSTQWKLVVEAGRGYKMSAALASISASPRRYSSTA